MEPYWRLLVSPRMYCEEWRPLEEPISQLTTRKDMNDHMWTKDSTWLSPIKSLSILWSFDRLSAIEQNKEGYHRSNFWSRQGVNWVRGVHFRKSQSFKGMGRYRLKWLLIYHGLNTNRTIRILTHAGFFLLRYDTAYFHVLGPNFERPYLSQIKELGHVW